MANRPMNVLLSAGPTPSGRLPGREGGPGQWADCARGDSFDQPTERGGQHPSALVLWPGIAALFGDPDPQLR
eukprot:11733365-Alexandrium_andersonii.AAC.1